MAEPVTPVPVIPDLETAFVEEHFLAKHDVSCQVLRPPELAKVMPVELVCVKLPQLVQPQLQAAEHVNLLKHPVTMVPINAVLASSVKVLTIVVSVNLKRQTNVEPETLVVGVMAG